MKERFNLQTFEGSRSIFRISVIAVILFSFLAYMFASGWGSVKISELNIDSRGSVMQATMYTPRNTNSESNLPCVIFTHGLSCNHSTVNPFAEELAKRGFAVLSVSTYGSGESETSDMSDPSYGMYDALQYVRTLNYVDQTRIGMIGHSQGSKNTSAAVDMDSSLLTLNDLKVNILYDTFGQTFTEEEIQQDADALAENRLTANELNAYKVLAEQAETYFNTRLKAAVILGGNWGSEAQDVSVAGYTVVREPNTNMCYMISTFNEGRAGTGQQNLSKEEMMAKFQSTTTLQPAQWYALDQASNAAAPASTILGNLFDISYTGSAALRDAIDSRTTRMIVNQIGGHAKDYFSTDSAHYMLKYFEQTLQYNCGNITDPATVPMSENRLTFLYRESCDLLAMFAMFVSIIALAGMLLQTKKFSDLRMECTEPLSTKKSVPFWIAAMLLVLATMFAEYYVATKGPMLGFKSEGLKHFLSLDFTANIHLWFMWILSIASFVVLVIFGIMTKKSTGRNIVKELNLTMSVKKVLRTFLLSCVLIVYAYLLLAAMKYFFHQDFRFWDNGMKDMLPQYWTLCLRYMIFILPSFLVSAMMVNGGRMKDMNDGLNTLLQMVIAGVGVYILVAYSYGTVYAQYASTGVGRAPAIAFISTWPMLINLPVFAFINRKLYKVSGNVWLPAFVNTWLVAWSMVSCQSQTGYYLLTNFATKWLGIF